jgi:hypothetical protein
MKVITKYPYWACGRPMGQYRGLYPVGFIKRLKEVIELDNKQIVHLFAGKSTKINDTDVTLDIKQEVEPDIRVDCRTSLPLGDNFADVILADPPYDSPQKVYGKKLYGTDYVPPYSFIKEMVRVTKPSGHMCILHQLVYKTPKDTMRYAVIPITTGPNMRIRVLNIFQKVGTHG